MLTNSFCSIRRYKNNSEEVILRICDSKVKIESQFELILKVKLRFYDHQDHDNETF